MWKTLLRFCERLKWVHVSGVNRNSNEQRLAKLDMAVRRHGLGISQKRLKVSENGAISVVLIPLKDTK